MNKKRRVLAAVATAGVLGVIVAGPASAKAYLDACTYSASTIAGASTQSSTIDTSTTRDPYRAYVTASSKAINHWGVVVFDNTGRQYFNSGNLPGGNPATGPDLQTGITSVPILRTVKPYVRIIITATDGQTCTVRTPIYS